MHEIDRTRRVSELLKRELAMLISRELDDSRLRSVTINDVTISKDLKNATIYVSSLEASSGLDVKENSNHSKGKSPSVDKLLNNAAKFLRRLLSQRAELRITPTLRFKYDDSIQRGVDMSSLISSLNSANGKK